MARFIGGSHDGAEYHVLRGRGQARIRLPSADRRVVSVGWSLDSPEACSATHVEDYRLERIQGSERKFEVYVHESLSPDMMLHKLIDQYRTIPAERQIEERKRFEAMIENRKLPTGRNRNSDGSEGTYKFSAVQLAWEAWLESAGYSAFVRDAVNAA